MTDFSDCIGYIDRVKVEFFERFTHLQESIAALEDRVNKIEPEERLERKWNTEPYESYRKKEGDMMIGQHTLYLMDKAISNIIGKTCKRITSAEIVALGTVSMIFKLLIEKKVRLYY